VGQGLKAQRPIPCGQGTGDGRARSARGLGTEEDVDGLLETALQQMGIAGERNAGGGGGAGVAWQMEAMNGIQKKQRADPLVEIVAGAAEAVERVAFGQQLVEGGVGADGVERA